MSHLPIPPLNILKESSTAIEYLSPLFDQATSSFWYIGLIVAHPILDMPFNLSLGQKTRRHISVSVNALMYFEILNAIINAIIPRCHALLMFYNGTSSRESQLKGFRTDLRQTSLCSLRG